MQLTIDEVKYNKAARKWQTPRAILGENEYQNALRVVESMMDADRLSAEETELLKTWGQLVMTYEESVWPTPDLPAGRLLQLLIEQRGIKPAALVPSVFSSRGHASQIITGKREISKGIAFRLAAYFKVPVDLFLKPSK